MDINTNLSIIFDYFRLFLGIIGVIGNVLVIIVFSRQSLRKYSYSFYCLIMAISDICFMTNVLTDSIWNFLGASLITGGALFCKIAKFMPYFFGDFSIHLLTLISIDRMISIVYPRRFLMIKKRCVQSLIVMSLALIFLSKNIIIPLYYNMIVINQTNSSQITRICTISPKILNIGMWISTFDFVIVNIIINNWINIKVIRFIMASRRRVNENPNSRNSSLSSRDRKFTICSICLNLVCMVCKLPFFISLLIVTYLNLSFEEINLIIKIASTITYIENGFSFFVNMLFNSLFYMEFSRIFRFWKSPANDINFFLFYLFYLIKIERQCLSKK